MLFLPLALAAGEPEFERANTALAGGDLAAAETGYRDALAAGAIDADVYYNLGNVLYREGERPLAILAWRRALRLDPRDPDAAANLAFARRAVVDDVSMPDPVPAWAPWLAALTADEAIGFGGVLVGIGLLAIAARRRFANVPAIPIGVGASALGVLLAAGGAHQAAMAPAAVVLADSLRLSSDLGGGVVLLTLHAGAEVGVVAEQSERVLLVLPDGRKGWASAADVGRVDPAAPMPVAPDR
jgi:tetratricopeptide (TPR) repeat protein